jgi:hypothetical protein
MRDPSAGMAHGFTLDKKQDLCQLGFIKKSV